MACVLSRVYIDIKYTQASTATSSAKRHLEVLGEATHEPNEVFRAPDISRDYFLRDVIREHWVGSEVIGSDATVERRVRRVIGKRK